MAAIFRLPILKIQRYPFVIPADFGLPAPDFTQVFSDAVPAAFSEVNPVFDQQQSASSKSNFSCVIPRTFP
jgi:hypothetical protein